ncbi:MAG: hypothetical protein PF440_02990 [Thiomicrorhabdus sp.]|jgi:DNA polymerase elongation subunit (family B)|nr:hypothetical protein [Thiomicrorhabdus sp.]
MSKPFYIDAIEDGDNIIQWYRTDEGVFSKKHRTEKYCYCFQRDNTEKSTSTDTPFKNIYDEPMKKLSFKNRWEMRNFTKDRNDLCETDISPLSKFMIDEFVGADLETPYNVMYYDIEYDFDLDDGRGYASPDDPFAEINSFQIFDEKRQTYILIIPNHLEDIVKLEDPDYPVEIYWSTDEKDMLRIFASLLEDIDILTGWFSAGFDLPYIMARSILLFGENRALKMYCRDRQKATFREFVNDFGQDVIEWQLVGRKHVDMLQLYKKFVPGEKPNFKLDTIAEIELGENKVAYDGDLGELYRTDPQAFYEYGIHDARLLMLLDKKKSIIPLAVMISRQSSVFISDVTGTVKPIETAFVKYCRKRGNIVLPDKVIQDSVKFVGAIVYETIAGLHGWVASYDITALYPACMIMLGVSTETFLLQCGDSHDDYVRVISRSEEMVSVTDKRSGQDFDLPGYELDDIIRENGYTISANGSVFNGKSGLLDGFVNEIFVDRKQYKKMAKQYYEDGDMENHKKYDLYQMVKKIYANSVYGCIGNRYFRLFDLDLAMSITLTGQMISKQQAIACDDLFSRFD